MILNSAEAVQCPIIPWNYVGPHYPTMTRYIHRTIVLLKTYDVRAQQANSGRVLSERNVREKDSQPKVKDLACDWLYEKEKKWRLDSTYSCRWKYTSRNIQLSVRWTLKLQCCSRARFEKSSCDYSKQDRARLTLMPLDIEITVQPVNPRPLESPRGDCLKELLKMRNE